MLYPYRNLFKTALIASPLMVLMGMLPRYFQATPAFNELFIKLLFEIALMLLIWMVNISLVKLFEHQPKQYLRYLVSIVMICITVYALSYSDYVNRYMAPQFHQDVKLPHFPHEGKPPMPFRGKMPFPLIASVFNNFFVLFIIDIIISRNREKMALNENSELRIKNLEAQQLQLRQQIQPHFLFNSLNTLKSLISSHPAEAEEYLVKLSSFLRYNLSSTTHDLILLKDELAICDDYLQIQKVRFKEALKYSIEITDENALSSNVPIFAIQLLIENAIKHNVLTTENPLQIQVTITEKNEISVSNNLQVKTSPDNSTQIGLENLSKRYQLLIKKDIQIIKTRAKFEVLLPLV
jgi:two-component system LytT family sensor kinase